MCGILALLFIAIPAAEIFVIIQFGAAFGFLPTLGVIVATAVVGAYLARTQGIAALRRLQEAMSTGDGAGQAIIEGALILVAGVVLLTPGFLTDALGLFLLIPPSRRWAAKQVAKRITLGPASMGIVYPEDDSTPSDVIDV